MGAPHLPDTIRLWQGDSVGHWEGDTLVVDTTNLNGKTWLNEAGEMVSYAEHVVERFTPTGPDELNYEATVTDPVVYSRPWTITLSFNREPKFELTEAACHEEDNDLPHLKAIRDAPPEKNKHKFQRIWPIACSAARRCAHDYFSLPRLSRRTSTSPRPRCLPSPSLFACR